MTTIATALVLSLILACAFIAFCILAGVLHSDPGHFDEPDSDAQFSEDHPVLVECDTAGIPTPPHEVQVYEYLWNPAQSAYELSRVTPLSEYHLHGSDPDLAQILSRTPPPAVIPGAPVKARSAPESDLSEIERRLEAPAFRDLTNHGAPLDHPGREF